MVNLDRIRPMGNRHPVAPFPNHPPQFPFNHPPPVLFNRPPPRHVWAPPPTAGVNKPSHLQSGLRHSFQKPGRFKGVNNSSINRHHFVKHRHTSKPWVSNATTPELNPTNYPSGPNMQSCGKRMYPGRENKANGSFLHSANEPYYVNVDPDEKSFFCDNCEKHFSFKNAYDKHMSEHRVCGLDGCSFAAHYKIIEKHVKMQHLTGLYDKISYINTPESIKLDR
ncbi:hypothetical protein NQ317_011754 [Molorchus minor]|uniref:C2H2-type domain-containing protein n=1 Tax=Molorchus minor TaxID=1323400 RepID=A0ABQ9JVZ4_9CUCU|nr:hypothetical protein NQ317_011754 [Molorchus minor]